MDKTRNEYIRGTAQVGRFLRQNTRGKTEMVWTRSEAR